MNNLAQFKARMSQALASGEVLEVSSIQETQFKHIHPFFALYPLGLKTVVLKDVGRKVGRIQSNSFTTLRSSDGRESWMDWGKAKDWAFSDNSAVWTESYESADHSHTSRIKFVFPS